jgi:nucleotide-binding universal stress UspA family protein
MKRILVATDGSVAADRTVDYAAQLAKSNAADLLIVNVIGGYGLPGKVFRAFTSAQQTWLEELLASISAEPLTKARDRAWGAGAATIQLESRTGDVAQTIIEIAQEKEADLIVVGKRGAGLVAGLLLGSVSQKLVSLSPLPVTVVPDPGSPIVRWPRTYRAKAIEAQLGQLFPSAECTISALKTPVLIEMVTLFR